MLKLKKKKKKKKKTDHDHSKYITTKEFNKLTAEIFTTKLRQSNLATKADTDDLAEKRDLMN